MTSSSDRHVPDLTAPGQTGRASDRAAAVTVRRAGRQDQATIDHLDGLSTSTRRALARDLAGAGGPGAEVVVLVAEVAADHLDARPAQGPATVGEVVVVGAALGQVLLDEGHVLDLAVTPSARGRGIGGVLLAALLDGLRERGATAHTLEVRPTNLAALALYRSAGFVVEGRRPRYYPDGEDALLLWRRDEEGGP